MSVLLSGVCWHCAESTECTAVRYWCQVCVGIVLATLSVLVSGVCLHCADSTECTAVRCVSACGRGCNVITP